MVSLYVLDVIWNLIHSTRTFPKRGAQMTQWRPEKRSADETTKEAPRLLDSGPTMVIVKPSGNSRSRSQKMLTARSALLLLSVPVVFLGIITMCKSLKLFAGRRPRTLGVKDGKFLAKIKSSPNNVSSQADKVNDASHYVEPFPFSSGTTATPKDAIQTLKSIVESMDRTAVIECTDDGYLYAEFTTRLFGFVDDVEFYADRDNGVVQVRSSSRVGYGDAGVNRQRVESIRQKWLQATSR